MIKKWNVVHTWIANFVFFLVSQFISFRVGRILKKNNELSIEVQIVQKLVSHIWFCWRTMFYWKGFGILAYKVVRQAHKLNYLRKKIEVTSVLFTFGKLYLHILVYTLCGKYFDVRVLKHGLGKWNLCEIQRRPKGYYPRLKLCWCDSVNLLPGWPCKSSLW